MKQRKPMKRTPFRRQRDEGPSVAQPSGEWKAQPRDAERPRNRAPVVSTVKPITMGTYARTSTVARPKSEAYRDRALLDMAEGRPCLLLVPGCCNHRLNTTVACHSNMGQHGKAGARKADDCYSCWGCSACHEWLDRSGAQIDIKNTVFFGAHIRQVLAWRAVAADPSEPPRFRRAAQRVLDQLNETS